MANWTQIEIGEIWEKAEYIDEKNESLSETTRAHIPAPPFKG